MSVDLGNLPALMLVLPLVGGVLCTLVGLRWQWACQPLAVLALAGSATSAVLILLQMVAVPGASEHYWVGGWTPSTAEGFQGLRIGIELMLDPLNCLVAAIVSTIALLSAIYARTPIATEFGEKEPHFYALFLIFVTGLLGITVTGDAFNLYVLIEIASISCYALIAMGKGAAPMAAFNYVLLGSIGASFYLLGVGYLYVATGALNMADIAEQIAAMRATPEGVGPLIITAFVFCLVGLGVKMAMFPLHWWLPNAYTKAQDAVSALLAPLFTKVSVYALIRLILSVFGTEILELGFTSHLLVWLGSAGILYGSVMALRQTEFKRILSYILVAEMGYFAGGIGLANHDGWMGAMLHIGNDAIMMACLFMVAGSVAHRRLDYRVKGMSGIFKTMPWTSLALVIGALAVIGVPPTCGFFTKWFLVLGAIEAGHWELVVALLVASVLAAVIFFRIFEVARQDQGEPQKLGSHIPYTMRVPMMLVALGIIAAGLGTGWLVGVLTGVNPFPG